MIIHKNTKGKVIQINITSEDKEVGIVFLKAETGVWSIIPDIDTDKLTINDISSLNILLDLFKLDLMFMLNKRKTPL